MVLNTTLEVNDKNGLITLKGDFSALRDKHTINATKGINAQDINLIFSTLNNNAVSFYDFFVIEVYNVIKAISVTVSDNNSFFYNIFNLRSLKSALRLIKRDTWYFSLISEKRYKFDMSVLETTMKFKPLKNQEVWFNEYFEHKNRLNQRGALLYADVGSGKTYMSLAIGEIVKSDVVICIVPNEALYTVWYKSINTDLFKSKQRIWTIKDKEDYNGEKYILCHYEAVKKLKQLVPYLKSKKKMVIIDEIHKLTDMSASRSNYVRDMVNELDPSDVVPMSGTPIKALGKETLMIFKLIDKKMTNAVEKRVIPLYKRPSAIIALSIKERFESHRVRVVTDRKDRKKPTFDTILVKVKNGNVFTLENIAKEAKHYYEERSAELEEQKKMWENRYYDLYTTAKNKLIDDGIENKIFINYERDVNIVRSANKKGILHTIGPTIVGTNKVENNILIPVMNSEEKKMFREAKSIYKYPILKIRGEILGRVIGGFRILCSKALAENINYTKLITSTEGKLLIFSNYIDACDVVNKKLKEKGYDPLTVYGDNTNELSSTVSKFMNNSDKYGQLVTTYKSLSTAVPLTAANVILTLDYPFRSYQLEQAVARIDRVGQTMDTHVFNVLLDTDDKINITDRTMNILQWSNDMVKTITGVSTDIPLMGRDNLISNESYDSVIDYLCLPTYSFGNNAINW